MQINNGQYVAGLNSVDWTEDRRQTLEDVLHESTQGIFCGSAKVSHCNEKAFIVHHEAYVIYYCKVVESYPHSSDRGLYNL